MDVRFPKYALVVLLLGVCAAGCNSTAASPTSPEPLTAAASALAAEPLIVAPEFLDRGSCEASPPFGLRVAIVVSSGRGVILRGLRFHLGDALPGVLPLPSVNSPITIPTSTSIPTPGAATLPSSPIPIPGGSSVHGMFASAATSLPFFLRFGCGVHPIGILVIDADVADATGRPATSQLRVRVGR